MRVFLILFLLGFAGARCFAAGSPVLNRAAEKWLAEGERWAFTVQVRESDDEGVREVRTERYDPSKLGTERWELLTVNGQAPTEERRHAWMKSKARKHRQAPKSLADFFDFENATVVGSSPTAISYLVPLRSNHDWLFPVDRVALTMSVNRASYAIAEVKAGIDEPFRVALGLARITDVNFDMKLDAATTHGASVGPETTRPAGLAHVVISRLGKKIEYTWSDFRRVPAAAGKATAATVKE